tara:strand:- start:1672 stop:2067 length:396 start_codon:yes stop_codon:yes gene_type:complete
MKKLFEDWNNYLDKESVLNESIGVETEELLRTAVEKAYKDMVASHHPEQIYADTGEPVDPDAAAEARAQIMKLVASYLENSSESEEQEKDKKDVYEKGYSDGRQGYNFSSSYHGEMKKIYLDGNLAGAEGL